jgi:hypothetical protein
MARQPLTSTFGNLVRFLFTIYLLSAILFTAFHFVIRPTFALILSRESSDSVPSALEAALARAARLKQESGSLFWGKSKKKDGKQAPVELSSRLESAARPSYIGPDGVVWGNDSIDWHPVTSPLAHRNPSRGKALSAFHQEPMPMEEDFFLSKAFGESLQPSKVIPYFYRATTEFDPEDITITTLVTSNRFKVLAALVERYRGEHTSWVSFLFLPSDNVVL